MTTKERIELLAELRDCLAEAREHSSPGEDAPVNHNLQTTLNALIRAIGRQAEMIEFENAILEQEEPGRQVVAVAKTMDGREWPVYGKAESDSEGQAETEASNP